MEHQDNAILMSRPPPATPSHIDTANPIPSSSPAFATPAFPIQPRKPVQARDAATNGTRLNFQAAKPPSSVLPVLLPPQTLRPIAFRTITKKHNLTLTSSALGQLSSFVGKYCGSGWREEGLAERVLDEIAKTWKRNGGGILLEDGKDKALTKLLKSLEECMSGGRFVESKGTSGTNSGTRSLSRQDSLRPGTVSREDSQTSLGISALDVSDAEEDQLLEHEDAENVQHDIRVHLQMISAFSQPRLTYNITKKFFEPVSTSPSLFPPPAHKTSLFRSRYNLTHQRLMRMESFQTPTFAGTAKGRVPKLQRSASSAITSQQAYKLTPISNLLGRSGTQHVLLGLVGTAATGELALTDLTGSIILDLSEAVLQPQDCMWVCPGMIVLVEGVYEENGGSNSRRGGIGGVIGGHFVAISVSGPPCEKREVTLGFKSGKGEDLTSMSAGFGWIDFLGIGSEKAIGERMRRLEGTILGNSRDATREGRKKLVFLGEVQLDNPRILGALRKVLASYAASAQDNFPLCFVLMGNFVQIPAMSGGAGAGSIDYKEHFDGLASILSEFPSIISTTTFIFVPGDNDPWPSSFSAGAATPIPREGVPELFTSRIRRTFATANLEAGRAEGGGEAIWASNPARLSLFGPVHEIVLFRDDITSRFRRSAVLFQKSRTEEHSPTEGADTEMINENGSAPQDLTTEADSRHMDLDTEITTAVSHEPEAQISKSSIPPRDTSAALTTLKLVKTILDQSHLSPFPLSTRPVHWDHASCLHLYPLPTSLVLTDAEAPPFAVSYEGCHVMNPGRMVERGNIRWVEYHVGSKRGCVKEMRL